MILTDPQAVEAAQARERVLVPSHSGRRYAVAEVHYIDGELETFEVSGYLHSRARAGIRRAQLARAGRWLSPETRARMRTGAVVRVSDLWLP